MKKLPFYLLQTASNVALPIAALGLIGFFLDSKFNTNPWLLAVGIILGTVVAMLSLWRVAKKAIEESEKNQ